MNSFDRDRTHNNTRFWNAIEHEYPSEVQGMRASERLPSGGIDLMLYVTVPITEHRDLGLPPFEGAPETRYVEHTDGTDTGTNDP